MNALRTPLRAAARTALRVLVFAFAAGCSDAAPTAPEPGSRDPNAGTVIAEIALERGDCRTAAETYAAAAQRGELSVARRASEVALACEHLPAAWESVKRWRALAPNDRDAAAVYATVALKLYRIPEARTAIATIIRSDDDAADAAAAADAVKPPAWMSATKPSPNADAKPDPSAGGKPNPNGDAKPRPSAGGKPSPNGDAKPHPSAGGKPNPNGDAKPHPSAGAKPAPQAGKGHGTGAADEFSVKDADAKLAELVALLLEEADASAVLAAVSGAVETSSATPRTLALLAELSLEAYDVKRAEQYANLALKRNPNMFEAKHTIARTYVMRGDASNAIATAREIMRLDPKRGTFELAEVLASLDRLEEARHELERLRASGGLDAEVDRRLALLAFQGGDLLEAQRRFTELATSSDASDAAVLYLADIAERDGDPDTALAGYRRLLNSSLAVAARSRAAALLLDRKERGEALTLIDDYISEHPDRSFEMTITKAHLLADHGERDTGIALLTSALDRHPQHPSLQYDRAVLLERAGKVRESVSALEHLVSERPDDPTLMNALGYTMADHEVDLPHAESLIRKALAVMPDNPAVLDSLGWVRFRRGDSKGALEHLQRAYMLAHDPEIAAHWGEALWKSGAQQEARSVWGAALARNPDSDQLKATVTRLVSPGKK